MKYTRYSRAVHIHGVLVSRMYAVVAKKVNDTRTLPPPRRRRAKEHAAVGILVYLIKFNCAHLRILYRPEKRA